MSFNHFKVWEIKIRWKFMFEIIINQSESSTCLSTHSQTSSRTYLRHKSRIHGLDCCFNLLINPFFNPLLNPLWTHNWWHYMVSFKRTARITHPFLKEFAPAGNFGVRCPVVSHLAWMVEWINESTISFLQPFFRGIWWWDVLAWPFLTHSFPLWKSLCYL